MSRRCKATGDFAFHCSCPACRERRSKASERARKNRRCRAGGGRRGIKAYQASAFSWGAMTLGDALPVCPDACPPDQGGGQ